MYIYIYIYEYIDSLPFILEPASWKLLLKLFRKKKKTSQNPAPRAQYLETPIVFCWWWEKTHFIHPKIQCHLLAPLAQKEFQAKLWPRLEASDLLKAHQTSLATQISS